MGNGEWLLFNIHSDPAESINLAHAEREKLVEMIAEHEAYEQEVGVVYDVLPIVKPIHDALQVLQWLIVAIIGWSIFLHRHRMSPVRCGYALLQVVCLFGLFGSYFNAAGWALIALLFSEVLFTRLSATSGTKLWLSLLASLMLLSVLLIKSGYLMALML